MPSLLPIHLNGSNRTCNAMCNGKSKDTIKSQACFVKYWKWNKTHQECARPNQTQMGMSDQTHDRCRHPKMCKDANARISAKSKLDPNMSFFIGRHWQYHLEIAIQMFKPKSKVVEPVDYNTSKTTKNKVQCQISA